MSAPKKSAYALRASVHHGPARSCCDSGGLGNTSPPDQAEEERGQHDFGTADHQSAGRYGVAHDDSGVQRAEAGGMPLPERGRAPRQAGQPNRQTKEQAALQVEKLEQAVESRVVGQQPSHLRRGTREKGEQAQLEPEQRGRSSVQHCMNVEPGAEEAKRREVQGSRQRDAYDEQ